MALRQLPIRGNESAQFSNANHEGTFRSDRSDGLTAPTVLSVCPPANYDKHCSVEYASDFNISLSKNATFLSLPFPFYFSLPRAKRRKSAKIFSGSDISMSQSSGCCNFDFSYRARHGRDRDGVIFVPAARFLCLTSRNIAGNINEGARFQE